MKRLGIIILLLTISECCFSQTSGGMVKRPTSSDTNSHIKTKANNNSTYETVLPFKDGFANVERNGKWGCIDKLGYEVIPCKYEEYIGDFYNSIAITKFKGKYGLIDKTGKEVIPFKYDFICGLESEDTFAVIYEKKWGIIDKNGKLIVPCKYEHIKSYGIGGTGF